MIVVDSSVWIDFFHGVSTPEVERLDRQLGTTPLATADLILVEVIRNLPAEDRALAAGATWKGFRRAQRPRSSCGRGGEPSHHRHSRHPADKGKE